MKKSLKDKLHHLDELFGKPKTANEEAWDIIHDFYHTVLTYMEKNNITEAALAKKLSISRSAVSQMFNQTQNISIKKMVEIAKAIGLNIKFNRENATFETMNESTSTVKLISSSKLDWEFPCESVIVYSTKQIVKERNITWF